MTRHAEALAKIREARNNLSDVSVIAESYGWDCEHELLGHIQDLENLEEIVDLIPDEDAGD